jgi:exopolysaccharide biosynthesis polyprenyl glycosylphosphotransferase
VPEQVGGKLQQRRFWTHAVGLVNGGLAAAVSLPVLVAALVETGSVTRSVVLTAVIGGIWFVAISVSLSLSKTTAMTVGARVPILRGVALGLLSVTALGFWVPKLGLEVPAALIVAGAILLAVTGWAMVLNRRLPPARLLLVGPAASCANVIRELAAEGANRFELVGIVDDDPGAADLPRVLGTTEEMHEIVDAVCPDLIALVPGCDRPTAFARLIESASEGYRVLELAQFYEYAFGHVPVRDLTHAWFMSVLHLYQPSYSGLAKRTADLLGAFVLSLVALPLFPVLILAVRLTPGPIFIRQVRVGEHGRLFTMYKFRTMRADAEQPGQAVWAAKRDPRVTPVGRLMRRLRLDELPQIWNVLKGEMSIVGPRPERPEFIEHLSDAVPFWTRRHLVKPGITGWAQVKRGYTADAEGSLDKLSYDLWYIRHRSLTVDLEICIRTLAAVLGGESRPVRGMTAATELDPVRDLLPGSATVQADAPLVPESRTLRSSAG